jgi:hypothetical protein
MKLACILMIGTCTAGLLLAATADAASVQTLSNPVPNGYLQIDGDISDWLSVAMFNDDSVGDGSTGNGRPLNIDILRGAIAHDANNIYVLWRNTGDNMVDQFSNWIFFDMDRNAATGAKNANAAVSPISIGYEFNLGGTAGWNAFDAAGGFAGGAAGRTVAAGDSNGSGGADFIEWSISRTAVQPNGLTFNPVSGSTFHVVYAVEDTVGDYYPNNVQTDWFTYDAAGVYNPGPPGDADGNGSVDIQDYLAIQANSFTRVLLGKNGDANDDGIVDFVDFHQWKEFFPGGAAAADAAIAALSVPEPSSLILIAGAMFLILSGGQRRRG